MSRPNTGPHLQLNSRGIYEIHWTVAGRSKRISTRKSGLHSAKSILADFLLRDRRDGLKADADGTLFVRTLPVQSCEKPLAKVARIANNDDLPALELEGLVDKPGWARLRFNRIITFETAAEIVRLVNGDDKRAT